MEETLTAAFVFFSIVAGLCLYLLPVLVAAARRHNNAAAILAVTLLFGWTLLGWGIALVWSLTSNTRPKPS